MLNRSEIQNTFIYLNHEFTPFGAKLTSFGAKLTPNGMKLAPFGVDAKTVSTRLGITDPKKGVDTIRDSEQFRLFFELNPTVTLLLKLRCRSQIRRGFVGDGRDRAIARIIVPQKGS